MPSTAAIAKQKPITGALSKPGYTVIALDYTGRSTVAPGTRFKVARPLARTVTLQLRDKHGAYAGPIVAPGAKARVVITGFRAGAKLGRIAIKKGYALTKRLPGSALDTKRTAIAKRGVPIGARKLGEVKTASKGRSGPGLDPDRDGLPGAFDADDDGDLVLDNAEPPAAKASYLVSYGDEQHAIWLMNIGLEQTFLADQSGLAPGVGGYALNKNARNQFETDSHFQQLVALAMKLRGSLLLPLPSTAGVELDCTGLAYCTTSGKSTDMTQRKRYPADFDPDGDGFGSLPAVDSFNPANDGIGTIQYLDPNKVFGMKPGVDQTQIAAGQTMLERYPGGWQRPVMVNFVFHTVPALAGWWGDHIGTALATNSFAYPVHAGDPGTQANPALVHRNSDGDYWIKLHLWRPQRYDPSAYGGWVDMGNLTYAVVGRTLGANSQLWHCPYTAYKPSPDDDRIPGTNYQPEQTVQGDGVYDGDPDGVWTDKHTLTFEVNVSACQRASGVPVWNDGDQTASEISVAAHTSYGDAAEGVGFAFKPEPPAAGAGGTGSGGGGGNASPPASGTWRFADATNKNVGWTVHMNDAAVTKLRIQFHEATPITAHSDPSGWTCATATVGNPNDALDCTHPTGEPAGSDVSGSLTLTSAGSNGMPVTLTVTENGTDTTSDMTQTP